MTPAFERFITPARAYPQLWRLVLGLVLIAGVYFSWMALIGGLIWLLRGLDALEGGLMRLADGGDPLSLLVLLCTFAGMGLGAWLAARLLHRRGLGSLIGRPSAVLRDFVLGLIVMALIGGGLALVLLPFLPGLEPAIPLRLWLMFLPLALAGILLQTGAEELVFRGYLQQQLAARFASPLIWMGLPALLFGLAHHAPEAMGAMTWAVVAATGLFGLIAADLTARTGNLGLAWGVHFANNCVAILLISVMGGLDGLALFTMTEGAASEGLLQGLILIDMVMLVLVWLACVLWLRRR